nr:site-specific integrase [Cellulomonas sp. RIT-PI-Y]
MVQAWVSALPGRPGGVRRIHGVLVSILDAAVKARRIPRNEARGVNLPRTVKREHRYLSVPELDALLARCDAWTAVVRALALTGMRVGELAELRVRDVDLRRRRATVTRSTTTVGGRRVTGTTKTDAGSRTVPLADEVVDDMRALVKGRHRDDLVYTTPHGAQLRRDNLRRAFLAAFARSGLEGTMTVHDLRHTAASLAVASGASVLAVQRMLGHATPAITLNVYADLFDQDLDHVLDRMRALIAERRAAAQRPDSAPDEAA